MNVDRLKQPVFESRFYMWESTPVVALSMLEELRKARHKCQLSRRIVLITRLIQPEWQKVLYKAADLVLSIHVGHKALPK